MCSTCLIQVILKHSLLTITIRIQRLEVVPLPLDTKQKSDTSAWIVLAIKWRIYLIAYTALECVLVLLPMIISHLLLTLLFSHMSTKVSFPIVIHTLSEPVSLSY